ncbi:MAG: hypothetical protein QOE65_2871 [Solirubrobacteraceae bacterium]|jgi:hypothetical protein|nr:hypothetical protein [Solirubrobacteraceae bacterium]
MISEEHQRLVPPEETSQCMQINSRVGLRHSHLNELHAPIPNAGML